MQQSDSWDWDVRNDWQYRCTRWYGKLIEAGYILALALFLIGGITTYMNIKKNKAKEKPQLEYKVDKTKGYDYNNPKRFFAEPLMRYIMIPMASCFGALMPLAIPASIMNDGGAYLFTNYPWTNWYVGIFLGSAFFLLIAYTVLYYVRGWGDHSKWGMQYA